MAELPVLQRFVLASGSPRRRAMFARLGVSVRTVAPDVDETPLAGEQPAAYVQRVAGDKALAAAVAIRSQRGETPWILAADTVVEHGGAILGKPRDADEAAAMLRRLSGSWHRVLTGYVLGRVGTPFVVRLVATRVRFHPLDERDIADYLAVAHYGDKAGAYAIQDHGAALIAGIDGDYDNVVGLPWSQVVRDLRDVGVIDSLFCPTP